MVGLLCFATAYHGSLSSVAKHSRPTMDPLSFTSQLIIMLIGILSNRYIEIMASIFNFRFKNKGI
jgi:hypothetical protein